MKLTASPFHLYILIITITLSVIITFKSGKSAMITFAEHSNQFYTCPDSFTLETRNKAVRCIRYPQESYVAPESCNTPFATLSTDYHFIEDRCISTASKSTQINCPAGSEIYVQPGNDLCVKRLDGAIVAPGIPTKR